MQCGLQALLPASRPVSGLLLPVTAILLGTARAKLAHICLPAAHVLLHGDECCVLQLDGVIDRKVRFSPVLEGLSEPEYMHWMLGPFTDFPVRFRLPCVDCCSEGLCMPCSRPLTAQAWLVPSSASYCLQRGATCLG